MNFELAFVRKIKCVTIDPRPPKLSKRQRKWIKKSAKKKRKLMNESNTTTTKNTTKNTNLNVNNNTKSKTVILTKQSSSTTDTTMDGTTNTTQNTKNTNVNNNVNTNTQSEPSSTSTTNATTNATTELLPSNHHLQDLFNDDFVHKHGAMLHDCTVIIGMHPDQATEDIVDVAIQYQKPFAVVPCCVFPKNGMSMPLEQWVSIQSDAGAM
tara:strand:- start:127 stop:756 length:630 start_codon:yes stop_codon:yes gene_type:complete